MSNNVREPVSRSFEYTVGLSEKTPFNEVLTTSFDTAANRSTNSQLIEFLNQRPNDIHKSQEQEEKIPELFKNVISEGKEQFRVVWKLIQEGHHTPDGSRWFTTASPAVLNKLINKDGSVPDLAAFFREQNISLIKAVLTGAKFPKANLSGLDLSGADFRGADLSGADLRGANLRGADFTGANLISADLRGADFTGADFTGVNLSGANIRDTWLQANFTNANLCGANLTNAGLSNSNYRTNFTNAKFCNADLVGAYFYDTPLKGADFTGANLSNADLTNQETLLDVNLTNVNLTNAQLSSRLAFQLKRLREPNSTETITSQA